jgi:hypothetical protein
MLKSIVSALLIASTTGCVSTMPTAFGESTDVLAPHQVSLTLTGGGGAMAGTCSGCSGSLEAAGGQARVRYGIDGKQEIGVSGFGVAAFSTEQGSSAIGSGGGELSYKIAPMRQVAFVAGFGFMDLAFQGTVGVGGDLGVLVAPYMTDTMSVYLGARGGLVGYPSGAGGWSESVTLPIGFAVSASDTIRVIAEGGLLLGWEQFNGDIGGQSISSNVVIGGYGTIGIQMIFGEPPPH